MSEFKLNPEFVKPDVFIPLTVEQTGETYMISPVYDRLEYIIPIGHFMLKVMDDEHGLITLHMDAAQAMYVSKECRLEPFRRHECTEREFEGYLASMGMMLDDSWLEGEAINDKDKGEL